jgi:hypothetical protein
MPYPQYLVQNQYIDILLINTQNIDYINILFYKHIKTQYVDFHSPFYIKVFYNISIF